MRFQQVLKRPQLHSAFQVNPDEHAGFVHPCDWPDPTAINISEQPQYRKHSDQSLTFARNMWL